MHKLLVALSFAIAALVLPGCGTVATLGGYAEPVGVDKTLPPALQKAQATVNEAEILLISAHRDLQANIRDKVYTKTEATAYNRRLRSVGKQVDEVRNLIRNGNITAEQQSELARSLIVALHREIVARSRRTQ